MKKLLVALIFLFSGSLMINAQSSLDYKGLNYIGKDDGFKVIPGNKRESFDNAFYITINVTKAVGAFGDREHKLFLEDIENGIGGISTGLGASVGSMFFFRGIDLGEKIKLGLDVVYFEWKWMQSSDYYREAVFYASKIGPAIAFDTGKRNIYYFVFNVQPTYYMTYHSNVAEGFDEEGFAVYSNDIHVRGSGSKLRYGFGLKGFEGGWAVGFEYSWGDVTLEDTLTGVEIGELKTGNFTISLGANF